MSSTQPNRTIAIGLGLDSQIEFDLVDENNVAETLTGATNIEFQVREYAGAPLVFKLTSPVVSGSKLTFDPDGVPIDTQVGTYMGQIWLTLSGDVFATQPFVVQIFQPVVSSADVVANAFVSTPILFKQGLATSIAMSIYESDGVTLRDLSSYTAKMQIRSAPGSSLKVELSTSNGGIVLGDGTGDSNVTLAWTTLQSRAMNESDLIGDVEIYDSSLTVVESVRLDFDVVLGVTS